MNQKKVFLLLFSLVMISLFSNLVSAQQDNEGLGLGSAFETIRDLFAFLPDLVTLEGLIGEEPAAMFWAKFLVWLLLFAVIYFGASKVFGDNKRIAVIVALVIALMGSLLMPNDMLINIFQTYGLLAGIIIWIIPVAAGMFIAHKVENRFLRALIYGLAAWILFSINKTIVVEKGFVNTSFPFFGLLMAVVIILFFWNLFAMFGGGDSSGGGGSKNLWDWATGNKGSKDGEESERSREEREEEKAEKEAKKALGASKTERELMQQIQNEDAKNLDTDQKIKRQLALIKDFIHQYLTSKFPLGGMVGGIGFNEYRRRKSLIIPKIQEIVDVMDQGHERYEKVRAILKENRKYLGIIHNFNAHLHAAPINVSGRAQLKTKLGSEYVAVHDEFKADRVNALTRVDAYLNDEIKDREKDRRTVIEHVERRLNEVLEGLNKTEPKFPSRNFNTTVKKIYEDVEENLRLAIKRLNYVIKVDRNVLKIGRRMEEYDQFLIDIFRKRIENEPHPTAPGY